MNDHPERNGGGDLEALRTEAHQVESELMRGFNAETVTRWFIASKMARWLDDRLWERLDYDSENAWFGSPHVPWSRSYARGVLSVYRALVKERGVDPKELTGIDLRNLQVGLPLLKDGKVTAKRLISDAKALSRTDMEQHYDEGPDEPLDAEREPVRVRCPTCEQWTTEAKLEEVGAE